MHSTVAQLYRQVADAVWLRIPALKHNNYERALFFSTAGRTAGFATRAHGGSRTVQLAGSQQVSGLWTRSKS